MINKLEQTRGKYGLFPEGGRIVVALSGGADSTALLHALYTIKEKYSLTLFAAHLNHGIRGDEADRDEVFCKRLCEGLGIELFVKRLDIPSLSRKMKISEELCGRNERYAFFEELSLRLNAEVATAHNACDNAETLIFNLTRGASLAGAAGIPAKRGNIIRPLIEITREEIESYCADNKLEYVTDSTNLSDDYTRNKIRHNVTPALRELNPRFEEAALRFCRSAGEAADYIAGQAALAVQSSRRGFGYSCKELLSNHPAVLGAAIRQICGAELDSKKAELIKECLKNGGAVEISKNLTAVCSQGVFRLKTDSKKEKFMEIELKGKIRFEFGDNIVETQINDDADLSVPLVFRTRQSGDTFTYFKRNIKKPLRKAMNEQKLPAELRDGALLLCRGGEVLWCEGIGYSAGGEEMRKNSGLNITLLSDNHHGNSTTE